MNKYNDLSHFIVNHFNQLMSAGVFSERGAFLKHLFCSHCSALYEINVFLVCTFVTYFYTLSIVSLFILFYLFI